MENKKSYLIIGLLVFMLLIPQYVCAKTYQVFGKPLAVTGYIQQRTAWRIGADEDFRNVTDYFTMDLEMQYTLNEYISFYGIFRFDADWAYVINRGADWWKKGGSGLKGSYDSAEREHALEYYWAYGRNRDLDLPRELYADIYLGNWQFRIGKQQVVWGESDGIRLMDCINALDLQREAWFFDSDEGYEESRIPVWMINAKYFWPKPWFNGLIDNQSVQFIIIPRDIEHARYIVGGGWRGVPYNRQKYISAYGDLLGKGGPWAFPYPWYPRWIQGAFRDDKPSDDAEFAVRFTFDIKNWLITINGFYGYQDYWVFKWEDARINPAILNGTLNPSQAADLNDIITTLTTGLGITQQQLVYRLTHFPARRDHHYAWGGYTTNNPHLLQLGYTWHFGRKKLVGFTVDHDLEILRNRWTGNTSPVLRIEAQYEFSKPFNTLGKKQSQLEWLGLPEFINYLATGQNPFPQYNGIVHRDVLRYMIGYDWPIWIKWLNPHENFFTSFQFFHFRIIDYGDEELNFTPFVFRRAIVDQKFSDFVRMYMNGNFKGMLDPARIPRDRFYITYLVQGKYDHDRIVPQLLYVHDLNEDVFWIKAKVKFQYGDNWREEIGWLGIFADEDADWHHVGKSFGYFAHADQFWFSIKRQFN